jgi:putative membrane protein
MFRSKPYSTLAVALIALFASAGLAEKPAEGDARFVVQASTAQLAQVHLGKLAARQSPSADVRQFAQRLVDEGTRLGKELGDLASRNKWDLAAGVDGDHNTLAGRLAGLTGEAFDREYLNSVVKDSEKLITLFETQARNGKDAALREWAGKTLPSLRGHLKVATSPEYERAMTTGNAALLRKDWQAATNAFTEALNRRAGDPAATAKLNEARTGMTTAKAGYDRAIAAATAALARKDYAGAIQAYNDALGFMPGDAVATAKLAAARAAMATAKAGYDRAIATAAAAMARKDYPAAIQGYTDALGFLPGDTVATAKLAEARAAMTTAKNDFDRLVTSGDLAMLRKDYAAAVQAYTDALKIKAGDPIASGKLTQAQNAKRTKDAYDNHMQMGMTQMRAKNFKLAETFFRQALIDIPGDPEAMKWLDKAQKEKP